MAKGIQESNGRISIWKAVSALLSFFLVVSNALLSWVCFSVVDHEVRITSIEANRFTSRDALETHQEIERRLDLTTKEFNDRLAIHRSDGHPASVLKEVENLKQRIRDLKDGR